MMQKTVLPRYSLYLRLLQLSLILAAACDFALALLLIFAAPWTMARLGLPLPSELGFLWTTSILFLMSAALCCLAAHDPRSYGGNIAIVFAGRVALSAALFAMSWQRPDAGGLVGVAAIEGLVAVAHITFWGATRR